RAKPETQSFFGDPIAGNTMRRGTPSTNTLSGLTRKGGLRLLIIDPSGAIDIRQVSNILRQGELQDYRIAPHIARPSDPAAKELIERERLSDNTFFWGFLDDTAKYHHGGSAMPTHDSIVDTLRGVGWKSALFKFRELIKENPESLTLKLLLLDELQRTSSMKAMALTRPGNMLDDSKDNEIWGEFVRVANSALPELMQGSEYEINYQRMFRLHDFEKSELLQKFAQRHIVSVENALVNMPHSKDLWRLWAIFSLFAPRMQLQTLLETLTPIPDATDFPPTFLYPDLIQNYQRLTSWWQIIELVEPIWESYQKMADDGENIKHRLTQGLLQQYIDPLCSAYEKLGQHHKAEKIRETWVKAGGWKETELIR
ncbi:MAG: hypothetical protein FWG02_11450, partial [Holophagaceae bacterium]|nr:hypothetical protein [Holophagaceae bacterium]